MLLFDAMIPALEEVGSRFESGEYFLPEMLISARAMRASMEVLRPHMSATDAPSLGTVVMGTVAGDIHDIGKDMVDIMLEGAGFAIVDLGVNVPAGAVRRGRSRDHRPGGRRHERVPDDDDAADRADHRGDRRRPVCATAVRIIVGGAPIDEAFAAEVGADGYAPDASSAVRVTKALLA